MSEHKGPWQRASGNLVRQSFLQERVWWEYASNGAHIATHNARPDDCERLVPLSEVNAVKAEMVKLEVALSSIRYARDSHFDELMKMEKELAEAKANEAANYFRGVAKVLEAEAGREATHTAAIQKARTLVTTTLWGRGMNATANGDAVVRALVDAGADLTGLVKEGNE